MFSEQMRSNAFRLEVGNSHVQVPSRNGTHHYPTQKMSHCHLMFYVATYKPVQRFYTQIDVQVVKLERIVCN